MRAPNPARRLGLCTLIVIVVFAVLTIRVTQLQVLSGDRYRALALDQRLRTIPLTAERGSIFDRNGRDLALSVERSSVYADPTLVTDAAMYAARLAPVVGEDQATLLARLSDRTRRFVYVARTVEDAVAKQVRALGLPGVGFVPEPKRQYPAGSVAAAIVGRVGGEGTGLDGLEAQYEDTLTGTPGELVVERDQHGREIPDTERRRVGARAGTDLVLTIDQALQFDAEQTLVDQVTATGAKGGMAVILDVRSGDVLAMATVQGATADGPPRPAVAGEMNKPLTDLFEPGSTNKVITIANAMDRGLIGPSTPFDVPWEYWVNNFKQYHDDHQHPQERWSTTDILRESSNIGTIKIAQLMTNEQFAAGLRDFGLGARTPIDFPGRPAPQLLEPDNYYKTGLASSAIGYSVAVTATHMVDVYATIARGGLSLPPRLVDATIDADGNRTDARSEDGERVVSEATAAAMNTMLREVVRAGTGACAAISGYTVAGKTGTSRKLGPGGYIDGQTLASFAGFAPAEDPRFAAIVVLDNPSTQYGARAAAPVFSEVLQFALTQYRVAPTDTGDDTQYAAAQAKAESDFNDCTVPHGEALQQFLADQAAEAAAQAQAEAEAATGTTVATGDGADATGTLPDDTSQSE